MDIVSEINGYKAKLNEKKKKRRGKGLEADV